MKNNKVSLVIPYYNSSIYLLRKCLDSCLNQTYDNIEILVLIDGSTKDTSSVEKYYTEKYSNVVFLKSKENHGVSYQRNLGIKEASGKYISFVDSDDYIEREMIEKMVLRMKRDNSDIVICGVADSMYDCEDGLYDTKTFFSFPSRFCHVQYTNFSCNKLFKLDVIKNNKIHFDVSVKLGEDAVFCQEYYNNIKYISCMYNRFYHYVRQTTSSTNKYSPDFFIFEEKVISSIDGNFLKNQLNTQEWQYMHYWHYRKAYLVYEHYYNAFEEGAMSKRDLLDVYRRMMKKTVFSISPAAIKNNKHSLKKDYAIAKSLVKHPKSVFWTISRTRGVRSIVKAIIRK